ncbi:MAG: hypothetical protein IIA67_04230 [Planctomycetes bacterium]|nr:hypothetical protein [Planctomycetota bacterium]
MTRHDLNHIEPTSLAELFWLPEDERATWSEQELRQVFAHQLAAPLVVDMRELSPELPETIESISSSAALRLETFGDVLRHEAAPVQLLRLIKRFAKTFGADDGGPLPRPVSAALYLASIAAALVHRQMRITEADDAALAKKFRWAKSLIWLDEPTRSLFDRALSAVEEPPR